MFNKHKNITHRITSKLFKSEYLGCRGETVTLSTSPVVYRVNIKKYPPPTTFVDILAMHEILHNC